MSISIRSYVGKNILALVRQGDFAHPGEKVAIDLTMAPLSLDNQRKILDVACGLGGTAKYMQDHGWGQVTGIDIEPESITYAQSAYPDITFHQADVVDIATKVNTMFDCITIFSSFFLFCDKINALKALHKTAKPQAQLIIFDYYDLSNGTTPIINKTTRRSFVEPLSCTQLSTMLTETGWTLSKFQDLTPQFTEWYEWLVAEILNKKNLILTKFGSDAFDTILKRYQDYLQEFKCGNLGGGIFYALRY